MPFEISFNLPIGKAGGLLSRLGVTLFLAIFLAGGLFFVGLAVFIVWSAAKIHYWRPTPCTILSSDVEQTKYGHQFALKIQYRYEAAGEARTSRIFQKDQDPFTSDDYRELRALADFYRPGTLSTALVDPAHPNVAVLKPSSFWPILIIPFALIFVAIGGGGIYAIWRGGIGDGSSAKPISKTPRPTPKWGAPVAMLIFLAVGGGLLLIFIRPGMQIYAARRWMPTQATVLTSAVGSHSGDESDTYSVDVFYEYAIAGRTYRSNRYEFIGGSSSGYESKRRIVDRMPPGAKITCYVNRSDPTDAVIDRSPSWVMLFAIIPLVFVLLPLVGAGFMLRQRLLLRKSAAQTAFSEFISREPSSRPLGVIAKSQATHSAATELKPLESRRGRMIRSWIGALVSGGIGSYFVVKAIGSWRGDETEIFFLLILIPIAYVAIRSLIDAIVETARAFAPQVSLSIDPPQIPIGGSAQVRWSVSRPLGIRTLTIELIGGERTSSGGGGGNSTHTETDVFFTHKIVQTIRPIEIGAGAVRLEIPPGLMPTWTAPHAQIAWMLSVRGEIPGRGDIRDLFEISVIPEPNPSIQPADFHPSESPPLLRCSDSLTIETENRRTVFAPGEKVRGEIHWHSLKPGARIEVRLIWHTTGDGEPDASIVDSVKFEAVDAAGAQSFELHLPLDAPPSFYGRLVTLNWAIEVVEMASSRATRLDLIVSPSGRPIQLPSLPDPTA